MEIKIPTTNRPDVWNPHYLAIWNNNVASSTRPLCHFDRELPRDRRSNDGSNFRPHRIFVAEDKVCLRKRAVHMSDSAPAPLGAWSGDPKVYKPEFLRTNAWSSRSTQTEQNKTTKMAICKVRSIALFWGIGTFCSSKITQPFPDSNFWSAGNVYSLN